MRHCTNYFHEYKIYNIFFFFFCFLINMEIFFFYIKHEKSPHVTKYKKSHRYKSGWKAYKKPIVIYVIEFEKQLVQKGSTNLLAYIVCVHIYGVEYRA